MEIAQRTERTEPLVALFHEHINDIKQSLASLHGDNRTVRTSTSTCPTVPAYTRVQLITLDSKLRKEE